MRLPLFKQLQGYNSSDLAADSIAGAITAILLVPQAIAYALLAGLPAVYGLYAAILPPAVYALFGTSRSLSLGPVAVAALMVNQALSAYAGEDLGRYLSGAMTLSVLTALILIVLSQLKGGALMRFISHPVLSGFVSGAAVLIIISQVAALLGLNKLDSLWETLQQLTTPALINSTTMLVSAVMLTVLVLARSPLKSLLVSLGMAENTAGLVCRTVPAILALGCMLAGVWLKERFLPGVQLVGAMPVVSEVKNGSLLPSMESVKELFMPAFMIAFIGYVESVSVARALAAKHQYRIDANQEMRAMGLANAAAALASTMPVAGGFSRSVVNDDAGAQTQVASIITALLVAVTTFFFMDFFALLPKALLAAIIVVAVWQLIDWKAAVHLWALSKADAIGFVLTALGVVVLGVETGLIIGMCLSMGWLVWKSSQPHIAIIGRIAGTDHFRNVLRYDVQTLPGLLMIRPDENLIFTNTEAVEDFVYRHVAEQSVNDVVLVLGSISYIDTSGVKLLERLQQSLAQAGVRLHLAEVRGPVESCLAKTELLKTLKGRVHLSANTAWHAIAA